MNRAGVLSQQGAYQAFVPKPLPPCDPPLLMDDRTIHLLAEARGALGKLEGLSEVIPNPEYFIAMYVRKEALLSSQIEGTQASLVEVFAAEKQIRSSAASR
ncbi:MAG: Fic/DOC family N-terminal domain-containing protein [bacterium]|nr:Fic/DOC family N-terminal domain-containing protein [bacterium]